MSVLRDDGVPLCDQFGCLRIAGHKSFCTTIPIVAARADAADKSASLDHEIARTAGLLPWEPGGTPEPSNPRPEAM